MSSTGLSNISFVSCAMLVSCAPDMLVTFEQLSSNDGSNKGHPASAQPSLTRYLIARKRAHESLINIRTILLVKLDSHMIYSILLR